MLTLVPVKVHQTLFLRVIYFFVHFNHEWTWNTEARIKIVSDLIWMRFIVMNTWKLKQACIIDTKLERVGSSESVYMVRLVSVNQNLRMDVYAQETITFGHGLVACMANTQILRWEFAMWARAHNHAWSFAKQAPQSIPLLSSRQSLPIEYLMNKIHFLNI